MYLILGILRWSGIVIGKLLGKGYLILGLLFLALASLTLIDCWGLIIGGFIFIHVFLGYSLRDYSRSIVYSYAITNGIYLKRLLHDKDRKIKRVEGGWSIENVKDGRVVDKGFIKEQKVSTFKYYLVLFGLWIIVDDSSSMDTTVIGYGKNILAGKQFDMTLPKFFLNMVKKEQEILEKSQYGRAFDLGENRTKIYMPILSTMWMFRNTFYNYNYMFEEIEEGSKYFFYYRFTNRFFDWHFGYIPYTNSVRGGRLVWFKEDLKHMDEEKKQ